jgi:ABC-type dipeptide/oligopeptide/nickel transport system ATPase component
VETVYPNTTTYGVNFTTMMQSTQQSGTPAELFADPQDDYTRALLAAIPSAKEGPDHALVS